jgi:autotransporter-associated beta strand protein
VLVTGNILVSSNGITPVGIIKDNTGTLTLSGANTYSDSTTVSNGLLLLTGSINSTNPVIVAGGTFAGTGTVVNTNVEVLAGGFLAPGAPTGTMTIDSALTVSGTLAINVNKSLALTNGEIALTGAFTNTGTGAILVSNLGPALAVGNKFPVFTAAVPGANTLTVSGAGAVWTNNLAVDGTIQVVSVTVPHPVITTATLVGTNLVLHGTNGVAGGPFNVRSSTNVAAPLSTWVVEQSGVYDGSGNFNVTNAITNSIPKKFYILQQ